ncbi:serine O-acetyltransferase [Allosphingosinicella indica]|uniref:Serine O-acetyltransferase n=1 Tax=Allosphingosinicella indica TaxID=941907 RepID=A0A1X7G174_9SPHN|nr:serine O-acetyltransferase [Allosphingosinicella indica]
MALAGALSAGREWWLISNWTELKAYIRADLASMGVRAGLKTWFLDPVARLIILMRCNEYLLNTGKPRLLRLPVLFWFRRLSVRLGFSLGPNIFGPGVAIVHHGLLVIDPTTRIGRNCRIHMGAHIGGAAQFCEPGEEHKFSPRIGDNVYIGPGAKIYGPVRIGDNCTIGANAVVTRSFPEAGLTLAGVPAKIIAQGGTGERVLKGASIS